MTRFDVIVIGAGVAGSAAALTLARGGLSVALVEAEAFPRRKVCGEYLSATNAPVFEALGLTREWRRLAGPEIRRVGVFAGRRRAAALLRPVGGAYGRGLGRDVLDGMLADAAVEAGAARLQPWRAVGIEPAPGGLRRVWIEQEARHQAMEAPVVVAAHGSWRPGPLPTSLPKAEAGHGLLGFKAHFSGARLAEDLMPLLAFPGGYGGMVTVDGGRVSLSCCIRADRLARLRAERRGVPAGEAVFGHILRHCEGVREALEGAERAGKWLAAGPIRPGLRPVRAEGVFRVGNLAGEAHPVIAEGISMAIQSGWLLGQELLAAPSLDPLAQDAVARSYGRRFRRLVGPRIAMAAVAARAAASPAAAGVFAPALAAAPGLLGLCVRLSGKYAAVEESRA